MISCNGHRRWRIGSEHLLLSTFCLTFGNYKLHTDLASSIRALYANHCMTRIGHFQQKPALKNLVHADLSSCRFQNQ